VGALISAGRELAAEPRGSYTALIMRIPIVGAGIGGLTLGIALERAGHAATIVEKRAQFKDEGAGVVLGPNVMTAVRLLDLTADIRAVGRELTGMNISDARGKVLGHSTYRVTKLPELWAPGKRVGVVPIGQGKTYAFFTIKAPPRAAPPFSMLEEFGRCWSDFGSPGAEAIAAVHDLRVLRRILTDMPGVPLA